MSDILTVPAALLAGSRILICSVIGYTQAIFYEYCLGQSSSHNKSNGAEIPPRRVSSNLLQVKWTLKTWFFGTFEPTLFTQFPEVPWILTKILKEFSLYSD